MKRLVFAMATLAACAVGCAADDDDDDDIPCTPFPEWHAPQITVQESVDAQTLKCRHVERKSVCPGDPDGCCYAEQNSSTGGEVECSTIQPCGAYDEAACLADSKCFVARNDVTNAFIGCYLAYPYGNSTRLCSERTAVECTYGGCVGLYAQPTDSTPQFASCTDR